MPESTTSVVAGFGTGWLCLICPQPGAGTLASPLDLKRDRYQHKQACGRQAGRQADNWVAN
jgi:hypothetical protein